MPSVCRVGDTGAPDSQGTPIALAPSTGTTAKVFANGVPVVCLGDPFSNHGSHSPAPGPKLALGSGSVFVGGVPIGRVGDLISCGSTVLIGSGNVQAG